MKDQVVREILVKAKRLGEAFIEAIGHMEDGYERTHAKQHAEDALAYVQKRLDEFDE